MNLQQIADTFKREAGNHWTVGNITAIPSGGGMPDFVRPDEHVQTQNAELYHVAKVFLHAVITSAHAG